MRHYASRRLGKTTYVGASQKQPVAGERPGFAKATPDKPALPGKNMKILIAGSHGMLGTDLMNTMNSGNDLRGIDLPEVDITRLEQCRAVAEEFRPDVILNAAAFTRVDDCETNSGKAFLVNGDGAGNLAQSAAASGALLVHYSTDYIFNGLKKEAYLEEDEPNPQSIYGKSKLAGEDQVRRHCPNHLILRTSWLFGQHGPNFIRTIVSAARQGTPLRVVNDQKGSPTCSRDLAGHTRILIEAGCSGIYHLTNSGACTWFELAARAIEWAGIQGVPLTPVLTSEFLRPAPRPANSVLANARIKREGFPLMRPWQDAAREYVEEYLKKESGVRSQESE
jgi:dTDP-4-dehydrorhamnose reductase